MFHCIELHSKNSIIDSIINFKINSKLKFIRDTQG